MCFRYKCNPSCDLRKHQLCENAAAILTTAAPSSADMFFSYRRLTAILLCSLFLCSGCARKEPPAIAPTPAAPQPREQVKPAPVALKKKKKPEELVNKAAEEGDYGCSYFYFLWGRHSELAAEYDASLEAYEKALICDPDAEFVISKLPLLLMQLNRSNEAADVLQEYLARHPDSAEFRMLLAKALVRTGNFQEAAEQYRKVHELNPKNASPLLLLSELHLAEGRRDQAKAALEEALAADSASWPAHLLLARLLLAEGSYTQAQAQYQQAVAANPSEGLRLEIAEALVRQEKYGEAVMIYRDLLDHDEMNEEARIALIHVHLLQKQEDKAMAELKRLKELVGSPEQAELTLAKLYVRWEEHDKAAALLEKLLNDTELAEARYLLAVLRFQAKQYDNALTELRKIGAEAEEYEDGLLLQVRTLREQARPEQAVQLLEAALAGKLQLSPDIHLLLAGLYQAAEQEEACRRVFERALTVYPEDERLLYEYGLFLDRTEKRPQAMKIMEKLVKINPEHAGALNYLGYTWADSKANLNQAFLYLSRAVKLKPDNAYIRDSLGWLHYRQGKIDEARKMLEQAVSMSPDDPAMLDHLAEVCLAAGDAEEALRRWRKALELHRSSKEDGRRRQERAAQESRRIAEQIERLEQKESK